MTQCKAKSKRTKEQCRASAMHGREVCYHHGGKSLRGLASRTYKHGLASKWDKILPARLAEKFEACVTDPKLLSLYRELALVRAREIELLQQLDAGESGGMWRMLANLKGDFALAQAKAGAAKRQEAECMEASDAKGAAKASAEALAGQAAMTQALTGIMDLIDQGASEASKWHDLLVVQEHMRRLSESEAKIRLSAAKVVTLGELYQIIGALRSVVVARVSDARERQAVIDGVRDLIVENNLLGDADESDG